MILTVVTVAFGVSVAEAVEKRYGPSAAADAGDCPSIGKTPAGQPAIINNCDYPINVTYCSDTDDQKDLLRCRRDVKTGGFSLTQIRPKGQHMVLTKGQILVFACRGDTGGHHRPKIDNPTMTYECAGWNEVSGNEDSD